MKMSHKGARVWKTLEDVFKSINKVTRSEEQMKAYNEPIYDSVSHVATERTNEVSHGKYSKPRRPGKTYNSSHFRTQCNNKQFSRNQGKPQYNHVPHKLNVTTAKVNTSSKSVKSLSRTRPSTS